MGYGEKQMEELRRDDRRARDADLVLIGTPIDLRRDRRHRQAGACGSRTGCEEIGEPTIESILEAARDHRRRAGSRFPLRNRADAARSRTFAGAAWCGERPAADRRRAGRERAPAQRRARHGRRAAREPRRHVRGARAGPASRPGRDHARERPAGRKRAAAPGARREARRRRCRSTSPSRRRRPRSARSPPRSCRRSPGGPWPSSSPASASAEDDPAFDEPDQADRAVLRRAAGRGARSATAAGR